MGNLVVYDKNKSMDTGSENTYQSETILIQ
jgi:hypothetical protein